MLRYRLVALLSCLLLNACAFVNASLTQPLKPLEETVLEGEGRPKILIVDITGIISEREREGSQLSGAKPSMVAQVREALRKAERDGDLAGVILRINSPGGTVTASDIIHHEIVRFRERKKVPVHACIVGVGASGGYYVAAAADRIVAHPTAVTGSIGVLVRTFNVQELMGKLGVSEQAIKTGDKKDILSPFRPATDEEVRLLQGMIDRFQGRFLDTIIARPGNRLDRPTLQRLADGRVFSAGEAVQAGLVDRIGYLDDVIETLKQERGLDAARVVSYTRPGSYRGTIYSGDASGGGSLLGMLALDRDALEGLTTAEVLYLWR